MWRLRRSLPILGRERPKTSGGLVKVAGSPVEAEAQTWAETLRRQGLAVEVRASGPLPRSQEPALPLEWEIWVRQADEPQARLILGLSGHSVIRLPRQKTGRGE